jgi:hypothetical protein
MGGMVRGHTREAAGRGFDPPAATKGEFYTEKIT